MKVVIPGGSGQVGTVLARNFQTRGDEAVVLSRRPEAAPWRVVAWDGETLGPWTHEMDGADVVINLAGRSVDCRYTARNRQAIMDSRVRSTRVVGEAIARATRPPRVWPQSSTATIYAHAAPADFPENGSRKGNDEATGIIGGAEPNVPESWRFSIDVASAWEREANDAAVPETRKVLMRSAMIMGPARGGVFDTLLRLVRWGLGGKHGDGWQFMSWIHEHDFVRSIDWMIAHDELSGPVNVAAPNPVANVDFMRTLRAAWGKRFGLPSTRWMLEIGTFFLRTETELILKSRRVVPCRLVESGFSFHFPTWDEAARDLCQRWRGR